MTAESNVGARDFYVAALRAHERASVIRAGVIRGDGSYTADDLLAADLAAQDARRAAAEVKRVRTQGRRSSTRSLRVIR
jgi:hypothetical protein